jgi:Zn-finger nucleic acid-binding protein
LGSVELDICRSCRGLWFDRTELRAFGDATSDTTLNRQVTDLLLELGGRASRPTAQTYVGCPVCNTRMARTNYASMSGIILHSCVDHGTWADHDAAVRFVELMNTGDEARLRELAQQHKERELQRQLGQIQTRQLEQTLRVAKLDARSQIHFVLDMFDIL